MFVLFSRPEELQLHLWDRHLILDIQRKKVPFRLLAHTASTVFITSEVVEPGLFGSLMLDAIQMFLSVVQRVLKAAITVIAVIPLSHFFYN